MDCVAAAVPVLEAEVPLERLVPVTLAAEVELLVEAERFAVEVLLRRS